MNIDRHLRRRVIPALCAMLVMSMCALSAAPAALGADAAVVSELEGVQPPADGLDLEVTGGDRFLVLTNGTSKEVVVKGYDDEPYLRFLPNRVVEVNSRAPSKYANEDRYALRPIPADRELRCDTEMAGGLARRQLPLVRPPHPPDGEGQAAAGEGRGPAHEDLRLGRSDDGRRSSR